MEVVHIKMLIMYGIVHSCQLFPKRTCHMIGERLTSTICCSKISSKPLIETANLFVAVGYRTKKSCDRYYWQVILAIPKFVC